jgi:ketosteroid isomerase-like protein
VAALLAASLLGGCGADEEGPPPADRQVRTVVERFAAATASKDYQTICNDLLSRALIHTVEEIGLRCETALERGLGDVQAPKLEIRQVRVTGDRALVSVHSTAQGQAPSDDALQLVKEHDQWRIAALAAPQGGGTSTTTTPTTTTSTGTTSTGTTSTATATTTTP